MSPIQPFDRHASRTLAIRTVRAFTTREGRAVALAGLLLLSTSVACAAQATRDEFFWLGEMNKATAVINGGSGLLDAAKVPAIAAAIAKVIDEGGRDGAKRPSTVISFEPLLIEAGGVEVTLLHAGRSSQDMHATYRAAILRDDLLGLAEQLNATSLTLVDLASRHRQTIVPNYTNGVAAQPNSYAHYLLGHAAGFERDAQRIREAYARIDRSAMGTTVLNGTGWPLDRTGWQAISASLRSSTTPTTPPRSLRWSIPSRSAQSSRRSPCTRGISSRT